LLSLHSFPTRRSSDLALPVNIMVAARAQHDSVVEVGAPPAFPPANVVGFAVFGRRVTLRASAVAFKEREPLSAREHADSASEVRSEEHTSELQSRENL